MAAPVALQLYTLREELAEDFEGTLRKIAEIGYVGVEPAGFRGTTPGEAARLFKELELEVPSAHVPLPVGDQKEAILDEAELIGTKRIISGLGESDLSSEDAIRRSCEKFNQAQEAAASRGLRFGIHNHWWEFNKIGKRYVFQIMQEYLLPEIFFEVDTYWAQTAGADPAAAVAELGERAPLLHIKDGPAKKDVPMTAVGDGVLDFHKIVEVGGEHIRWMIVELDACTTDMLEAVQKSYTYLIREGLARGKKS